MVTIVEPPSNKSGGLPRPLSLVGVRWSSNDSDDHKLRCAYNLSDRQPNSSMVPPKKFDNPTKASVPAFEFSCTGDPLTLFSSAAQIPHHWINSVVA